jgi:2-polyprenyl-3-methyl-5-hydroxy-6-metoxy-1,4-benzoquinol methylase
MPGLLNEDIPCNLCEARNAVVLFPSTLKKDTPNVDDFRCTSSAYGIHPPIVRCRQCGLVYVNPRWDSKVVEDNYRAVEDRTYVEEQEGRVLTFSRNLDAFEALVTPNSQTRRFLDVGCHIGVMVELAQKRGWEAWGVEPSEWAAAHARSKGLHVITGTLASAGLPENYFDVVTMWDVIEHLTDPASVLCDVHRVLKPGGILGVHTIDISSTFARLMGRRWPWLMEMHLYFFTPKTLRHMLEKTGFQVVHSRTQGRYLRLGYFITRVEAYSRVIARLMRAVATRFGWMEAAIPVNFGDLFTSHARKI